MIVFKLILMIFTFANISDCKSRDEWFAQKWLDENYLFKWKTNHLDKEVIIRVEVMTKGWVSFGFSKHGKTTEADIVIGWVDDFGRTTINVSYSIYSDYN